MKIYKFATSQGKVISGLLSESLDKNKIIIHFHGFGGDCLSNNFLQVMHERFPKDGISFLSINLRYSGYLVEEYSESEVCYSGASIINYENIESDVVELVDYIKSKYKTCILQGHSFGTNLLKLYLRKNNQNLFSIFLSPADSYNLYSNWKKSVSIRESQYQGEGYLIRRDIFGMLTDYGEYPIPITDESLASLLSSEIFWEWSDNNRKIDNISLIIKGSLDVISNNGLTKQDESLCKFAQNADCQAINGARHIFSGYEEELYVRIINWIDKVIT